VVDFTSIYEGIAREGERGRERISEKQVGGVLVIVCELDPGSLVEQAGIEAALEFGAALGFEIGISRAGLYDARAGAAGSRDVRERRIRAQRCTWIRRTASRTVSRT